MAFPTFSDYQEIFSSSLPPSIFSNFTVPSWVPQPQHLLRTAKVVYPYWKERRLERGGHRIIPILNVCELSSVNDSYSMPLFNRAMRPTARTSPIFASAGAKLKPFGRHVHPRRPLRTSWLGLMWNFNTH